ncbi:MAG: hypothetical protein V1794_01515 [Candidatus Glassbacteria bacterium]
MRNLILGYNKSCCLIAVGVLLALAGSAGANPPEPSISGPLAAPAFPAALKSEAAPVWDEPVTITELFDYSYPPLVDSTGATWHIMSSTGGENYGSLGWSKSSCESRDWSPPTMIVSGVDIFAAVIDPQDRITIATMSGGAKYVIASFRYLPNEGWHGPVPVWQSAGVTGNFLMGADTDGNVVLVFQHWKDEYNQEWLYTVYDVKTSQWREPAACPMAAGETLATLPILFQNRNGSHLYYAYRTEIDSVSFTNELYLHRFDSASLTWGTAEPVPVLAGRPGSTSTVSSFLPTVDEAGNMTVPLNVKFYPPHWPQYGRTSVSFWAIRRENGVWQEPTELPTPQRL